MTKSAAKAIALETIMYHVGTAYYEISDGATYNGEDEALILQYMEKYGKRIAKALNTDYVSY